MRQCATDGKQQQTKSAKRAPQVFAYFLQKHDTPKALTPLSPPYTLSLVPPHPAPFLLSASCADKQQGAQVENRKHPQWQPGVRALLITLQNTALASSVLLLSPSLSPAPPKPCLFGSPASAPLLASLSNF